MSEEKPKSRKGTAIAAAAGAIGSAAVAAAVMFAKSRKEKVEETNKYTPLHPEDAPETD